MYSVIPYLYRDAANYKANGTIVVAGTLSNKEIASIRAVLDDKEGFIPFDLDLPTVTELQPGMQCFPSEDDHVWHELLLDDIEVVEARPEGGTDATATDLLAAFRKVGTPTNWNVQGAMQRLGLP